MIFRKKSHFSMKMPFKMAAKAAPLFCREAARINRGEAAPLKTAHGSAEHSAPQAGTNLFLRPKAALFSFPRGSAFGPPFSFCRKKRTGRWSGPREKRQGVEDACHRGRLDGPPGPPLCWVKALPGRLCGVSGRISASGRTTGFLAPTIFLWYRQAAPSLFLKKRWWGRKHPSWRG